MQNELENFYLKQEEPNQSCFLALRDIILDFDIEITADWKYKLPFFLYKVKMFCYLWKDKKTNEPYISIAKGIKIEHRALEQGNRTRFKIMRINNTIDIPVETIYDVFNLAKLLYK
tara:strand:+ start:82 stop:429 length:348 start_codon:yes stop_codon:yes gene_type:complete